MKPPGLSRSSTGPWMTRQFRATWPHGISSPRGSFPSERAHHLTGEPRSQAPWNGPLGNHRLDRLSPVRPPGPATGPVSPETRARTSADAVPQPGRRLPPRSSDALNRTIEDPLSAAQFTAFRERPRVSPRPGPQGSPVDHSRAPPLARMPSLASVGYSYGLVFLGFLGSVGVACRETGSREKKRGRSGGRLDAPRRGARQTPTVAWELATGRVHRKGEKREGSGPIVRWNCRGDGGTKDSTS